MRGRWSGHGHDHRAPRLALVDTDEKLAAVLALLRGEDAARLAADLDVEPELVERWRDLFVEGGRLRLEGRLEPMSWEARERFLALVAHEFRTPLAVIAGWAQTLAGVRDDPELFTSGVRTVQRQVRHLELIVRDALDAAALANGNLRLRTAKADLRDIVARVVTQIDRPLLHLVDGGPVVAHVDGARIEQIVAAFAEVALRHAGDLPVTVRVESHNGSARIEVESRGEPLSFQDAHTLFEPFARDDRSRAAGIGLYLARALVVAHGGEAGVRGEGSKTTLWLRVPLSGSEA